METNIRKIKVLSKEKAEENWAFRAYLKECDISPEEIDAIVHRLYKEVSSKIDCKACGNCCKEITPVLDEEDIEKLSKGLGLSNAEFKVFNVYEALKEELWHKEPLNFDDFEEWNSRRDKK